MIQNNPGLGELLLKFLRNQQWKQEHTELARKVNPRNFIKAPFVVANRLVLEVLQSKL